MAAALRSFSTTTYASRTNCTVTAPSGITDGDILTLVFLIVNTSASPPSITLPSGFTNKTGSPWTGPADGSSNRCHLWIAEKTASSESGDYTITHSSASSQGMMLCAQDAQASTVTYNSGSGTTTTATGITTADVDALIAFVDQNWQLWGGATAPTGTTPTFTEQSDSASSLLYLATGVWSSSGATGDKTQTNLNGGSGDPWAGILIAWEAAAATQNVYPTTDTTRDNWEEDDGTTTNIYDQIDETVADDADYIRTQTAPSSDVYVTKFGTLTDPSSSTGHKVSVRYGKDSAAGDTISLVAQLRQGYSNESSQGTLIATALNNANISSGWTTATYTLTSGEADSITDYSSLYLRLVGNQEAVGYSTTPPSHGNTSAISTAGTTSTTITASTQSEGDLLLIAVESSDSTTAAGTPNTPANWTKIFEDTEGSGATGVTTLTIFARLAPAGGTGNVTVDGVLDHIAGSMMTITGHGVTTVGTDIVVGSAGKHGTGTTGLTTPGITVVANSLIVWAIGLSDDAADTTNASSYTNSNLASITERRDNTHTTGAGGGIALATATCSGTTTGSGTWAHDTAVQSLSVYLGIPPAKAPRRAQVSWARLQVPESTNPTGTGELAAQSAALDGTGASSSTGTSDLDVQAADVTGTGASLSTGAGALAAQAADVTGAGPVLWTATGALAAQAADVTGAGVSLSAGVGALAAQPAAISGSGESIGPVDGTGALAAQAADVAGAGVTASTGAGVLAAQSADLNGAGVSASTGTGTLVAQSAALAGAGVSASTGTGALAAQAADVTGGGVSLSTGAGALAAQSSAVDGVGALVGVVSGAGALAAQSAALAGAGVTASTGTGVLAAQAADVAGAGVTASTGAGVLAAQAAALDGAGVAASLIAGTGVLAAQSADVTGAGVSLSTGVGALAAQAADVTGAGVSASTGTGALAAQSPDMAGAGVSLSTGTGALAAQAAALDGVGAFGLIATGVLAAAASTVSGAGVTASTGAGALAARASRLACRMRLIQGAPAGGVPATRTAAGRRPGTVAAERAAPEHDRRARTAAGARTSPRPPERPEPTN